MRMGIAALATMLFAAGCVDEVPTSTVELVVELDEASAQVGTTPISMNGIDASGLRLGSDQGIFTLTSADGMSGQLDVCGMGDIHVDPYGVGGEGRLPPEDFESGPSVGASCMGSSVSLCSQEGCVWASTGDGLELSITDGPTWRAIVAEVDNATGTARLALRYHEPL